MRCYRYHAPCRTRHAWGKRTMACVVRVVSVPLRHVAAGMGEPLGTHVHLDATDTTSDATDTTCRRARSCRAARTLLPCAIATCAEAPPAASSARLAAAPESDCAISSSAETCHTAIHARRVSFFLPGSLGGRHRPTPCTGGHPASAGGAARGSLTAAAACVVPFCFFGAFTTLSA